METYLFWIIGVFTAISAVAVVVTQNIVRAATWLLFALGGTSALFFLMGADLVGAIQLLVYVGGTLILVVFGVMLTAQGPFISMKAGAAEWAVSTVVGVLFFGVLAFTAFSVGEPGAPSGSVVKKYAQKKRLTDEPANSKHSAVIGQTFVGVGQGPAHEEPVYLKPGAKESKEQKSRVVRAHYLLPFEIVSVHLLVVLIGAAYLARAKRRRKL